MKDYVNLVILVTILILTSAAHDTLADEPLEDLIINQELLIEKLEARLVEAESAVDWMQAMIIDTCAKGGTFKIRTNDDTLIQYVCAQGVEL